jgi:hypothetical protein
MVPLAQYEALMAARKMLWRWHSLNPDCDGACVDCHPVGCIVRETFEIEAALRAAGIQTEDSKT